ncbi:MAG: ATP-binding protein [Pseudomonadota bacterium]
MWSRFKPNSIFATIYGGMLLAIVVVGLASYGALSVINSERAQRYTEGMATALYHITAIAIARQSEENLPLWLQDAEVLMGTPLRLISKLPFSPSEHERERLEQGMAVTQRLDDDRSQIWIKVPRPGSPVYLESELAGIGEKQARAAATFYLEDLSNYPDQEDLRLRTMAPYIGFPMSLVPFDEAGLDSEQQRRLRQDEIVVRFKELTASGRSAITVYAPSQSTPGKLLRLGPMELFEAIPLSLVIMASVLALLIITLASYGLIHIFELRIQAIEGTVARIREGNLSARVEMQGSDEIARLAQTLNQMAGHIQRLLDAQRELTQAVSHELRTPLARLRFGMEMLAESEDVEHRYEQLERLDEDVEQLNQLIDEILTYANLEKGTPDLAFEAVDMVALMRRIERETIALRKPARLEVVLPEELVVDAVPRYIHRVIQNLVGNALRYADSVVRVTCVLEGDQAVLMVEDDGPGIPEDQRSRVFEPFTRLDDSRTRSTGGYGLGLSIVNRIVFWFAGSIRVTASSSLGGAAFTMRWPRRRGQ